MTFAIPTKQRSAILYGAVLLALTGMWWIAWLIAAHQYTATIDGWIEAGRKAGYEISYDDRTEFGFPRHVVLRFVNLRWKNADGIAFQAGDIDIGATLWQHQNFAAKFKGHAEIDAPLEAKGQSLLLAGESGSAEVSIGADGFWRFSRIALKNARIGRSPDYVFGADSVTATAERPDAEPKTHHDVGLTLSGSAENIVLPKAMPQSFGATAKKLEVNLRVMDAVPDFRKPASVDAWNKDSGVVEFDTLHIEWGPLLLAAKGTMGFDDDLQPEGAFSSTLGNHAQALRALMNAGFIAATQETMLQSAMKLFAKPSKSDDIDGVEIPIAVQLGGLFLGPVRIFAFPQIEWPKEPKP